MKTTIHHGWRFAMLAFLCTIYGCRPVEPEEQNSPNIQFSKCQDTNYYHSNYTFHNLHTLYFTRFTDSKIKETVQKSKTHQSTKKHTLYISCPPNISYQTITISTPSFSEQNLWHKHPISSSPSPDFFPLIVQHNTSKAIPNYLNKQFLSMDELNNPNDLIKQPGVPLNQSNISLLILILSYTLISILNHEIH